MPEMQVPGDRADDMNEARRAAFGAVGLSGHEVACDRYDRAITAFLATLAQRGYRLVPPADPS